MSDLKIGIFSVGITNRTAMGCGASYMPHKAPRRRVYAVPCARETELATFSCVSQPCDNFLVCNEYQLQLPDDEPHRLCGACAWVLGPLIIERNANDDSCPICLEAAPWKVQTCLQQHHVCLECFAYPLRSNLRAFTAWQTLQHAVEQAGINRGTSSSRLLELARRNKQYRRLLQALARLRDVFYTETTLQCFLTCPMCRGPNVWQSGMRCNDSVINTLMV